MANLIYVRAARRRRAGAAAGPLPGRRSSRCSPLLPTAALGEALRAAATGTVLGWPLLVLALWMRGSAALAAEGVPMDLMRSVRGPRALPRWAIASLVANIGIVVTGGLVRLTGSGLGCPTWPRCTADSFVAHPALGAHGAIEFGNRLLTFVLIMIAVLTLVSAMRLPRPGPDHRGGRRRDLRRLTAAWPWASRRRRCSAASPC